MNLTLYRKYRPKNFEELVGQNHVKTTLQNELEMNKVSHAYLFTGPRGVGKTTAARIFAKAINCQNLEKTKNEPCNKCDHCNEINEAKALDIIEIDAASNRGIDDIRDLREKVKYTPTRFPYKVYIIDEAHMLTIEAFNALLKTLEEPPAHAIFILVTTEVHKLPQTIISRTQRFDFRKINLEDLVGRLAHISVAEKKEVPIEILQKIAQRSEGCARDAESLLGQLLSLAEKKVTVEQAELIVPRSDLDLILELVDQINKNQAASAISLINKLVEEGTDLQVFVEDLIETLRKMMLSKLNTNLEEFAIDFDQKTQKLISELVKNIKVEDIVIYIEKFLNVKRELKSAEIIQFPFELAIVTLCKDDLTTAPVVKIVATQEVKKVIAKPAEKSSSTTTKLKLTLEQVKEKWGEVLVCVKKYNNSLASVLSAGRPFEMEGDIVQVCFKHQFHQERIDDIKNKEMLEKALKEIFGEDIKVKTVIIKELSSEKVAEIEAELPQQTDPGLDNILQTFGGKIVE